MKKVVFILSSAYAGSHFLSLQLGSHTRIRHVGELRKLTKPNSKNEREVFMVKDPVFDGIDASNIDLVFSTLFERLEPDVEVLVDASKKVDGWADRFLDDNEFDRRYIHLVRDPRALFRRWKMSTRFRKNLRLKRQLIRFNPSWFKKLVLAPEDTLLAYRWIMENSLIQRFVEANQLDCMRLSYHDLAKDPTAEISRLMEWLGVSYEPEQLDYWNFKHIGTQKKSYANVNAREDTQIDIRWQQDLSESQKSAILGNPDLIDFAAQIGMRLVDDGISRNDSLE